MPSKVILSAALLLCVSSQATAEPLLIISVDGLHPDYVIQADKRRLKIPVLREFVRKGTYASGVVGVTPTLTYPSHTTIMTGLTPAEHGISSNTTFDPLAVNKEGWYWYASDIKVPTLWRSAAQAKLKAASVNWPVTAGDPHIHFLLPEYWRASTGDDIKLIRALARPIGMLERYEKSLATTYVDGNSLTIEDDRVRTRFTIKLIEDQHPDLTAVHLVALDETEHEDGPFQPSAFAALEAIDAMIGELRKAALAANPRTVVAVVSDHGFRATHSTVNLRVPLVAAGLIKLHPADPNKPPQVASWDAQVWPAGGSAAIVLRDRKDERVRKQVEALLTQLKSDPKNGIARVLNAEELRRRGAFPEADWLVDCAPGFYAASGYRGALIAPAPYKGMHGYAPDTADLHAAFFIQGAGVGKRMLGVVDMRQFAPTFARILRVTLPGATQPALAFE